MANIFLSSVICSLPIYPSWFSFNPFFSVFSVNSMANIFFSSWLPPSGVPERTVAELNFFHFALYAKKRCPLYFVIAKPWKGCGNLSFEDFRLLPSFAPWRLRRTGRRKLLAMTPVNSNPLFILPNFCSFLFFVSFVVILFFNLYKLWIKKICFR